MIMDPVEFELIRQAEKANLTAEQEKQMHKWIVEAEVRIRIITDILNGDIEITGMKNGEPLVKFTQQGLANATVKDSDDFEDDFIDCAD